MHVALKQKTKRDDIYPALQFLYRYAMTRNTFDISAVPMIKHHTHLPVIAAYALTALLVMWLYAKLGRREREELVA
jgi:hypothetical protein